MVVPIPYGSGLTREQVEAHLKEVREAFGTVRRKYETSPAARMEGEDKETLGTCFGSVLLPLTLERVVQDEVAERGAKRESRVGSLMTQAQELCVEICAYMATFENTGVQVFSTSGSDLRGLF